MSRFTEIDALTERLATAVASEDVEAGDAVLENLRDYFALESRDHLDTVEAKTRQKLMDAILELERQKRAGPVLEHPERHVALIEDALDNGSPDQARALMAEIHGHDASGGRPISHEYAVRLVKLFRRPEWDTQPGT